MLGLGDPPPTSGLRRTALPLDLVATMVVASDERWSMAIIRDLALAPHDPMRYRRGLFLADGRTRVLQSADQWLAIYLRLKSASHITLSVERRGTTLALDYTVR